jgi:hypothetical protein
MIRHLNETYKFKEAILILFRKVEYSIQWIFEIKMSKYYFINLDTVKGKIRLSKTTKKLDIEV